MSNKQRIEEKIRALGGTKKNPSIRKDNAVVNNSDFHELEKKYGGKIPESYKVTYMMYGPFSFKDKVKVQCVDPNPVSGTEKWVSVDYFYSIDKGEKCSVAEVLLDHAELFDKKLLPICDGEPGDLICVCRRPLFPVSSKLEFLIFRAMVFQGFYPLNGSLQFGDDFRSPFVDKAFGRQPGIGNAVGHISWVSDILAPCEAAPCCNRLSILHTLPGLPSSCQTNRRSAVPSQASVLAFYISVLHRSSRLNILDHNVIGLAPLPQLITDKFWSVVCPEM